MGKIAITCSEKGTQALFDRRFGRAPWFCLYDDESGRCAFQANTHAGAPSDAGTSVAQNMVEWNIQKVVSGDFGAKAGDVLEAHNIQLIVISKCHITVQAIIDTLRGKHLKK